MSPTSSAPSGSSASPSAMPISDAAWEALKGGYDLQVHVAPDVIERRIDDLDLAQEFLAHGLRGFVLKSHYFPTAERAKVVTRAVPGIAAFGAITLNHSVGGLNPVEYWHRNVQYNHVRLKPMRFSNQVSSIVDVADYVKVRP